MVGKMHPILSNHRKIASRFSEVWKFIRGFAGVYVKPLIRAFVFPDFMRSNSSGLSAAEFHGGQGF
jgi:hypothetical protein